MGAWRGLATGEGRADRTQTMQSPADRDARSVDRDEAPVRLGANIAVRQGARRQDAQRLGALVLCGGASRRFGSDKALARVGEASLLERTLMLLARRTEDLVIATGHEPRYADVAARIGGIRVALDRAADLGPLAGLEAGLACFDPRATVLVVSCDLPNLDLPTLDALVARHRDAALDVCLWRNSEGQHPLLGCYSAAVLPAVRAALDRGERRLVSFHGSPPRTELDSAEDGRSAEDGAGRDVVPQGQPRALGDAEGTIHAVRPPLVGYLSAAAGHERSDPAANANSRSELRRILRALPASQTEEASSTDLAGSDSTEGRPFGTTTPGTAASRDLSAGDLSSAPRRPSTP